MWKIYQQSYHFSVKNFTTPFGTYSRSKNVSSHVSARESHVVSQMIATPRAGTSTHTQATATPHSPPPLSSVNGLLLCQSELTLQRAISRSSKPQARAGWLMAQSNSLQSGVEKTNTTDTFQISTHPHWVNRSWLHNNHVLSWILYRHESWNRTTAHGSWTANQLSVAVNASAHTPFSLCPLSLDLAPSLPAHKATFYSLFTARVRYIFIHDTSILRWFANKDLRIIIHSCSIAPFKNKNEWANNIKLLTWYTATKFVWKFWNEVVIDSVFLRAKNNDRSGVFYCRNLKNERNILCCIDELTNANIILW